MDDRTFPSHAHAWSTRVVSRPSRSAYKKILRLTHGSCAAAGHRSITCAHNAPRRLVDPARGHGDPPECIRRLRDVGRAAECTLHVRPLSLSALFASHL